MPAVLRQHGLRFMIFVDDHPPAHVHEFGAAEAKIEIGEDGNRPRMLHAEHMSGAEQRRALKVVAQNQAMLLQRWIDVHGRVD